MLIVTEEIRDFMANQILALSLSVIGTYQYIKFGGFVQSLVLGVKTLGRSQVREHQLSYRSIRTFTSLVPHKYRYERFPIDRRI